MYKVWDIERFLDGLLIIWCGFIYVEDVEKIV